MLTADDKWSIHELLERYCITLDDFDRDGWMELFEPQGMWLALTTQLRTRDDFERFTSSWPKPKQLQNTRHQMHGVVINEVGGQGSYATVRSEVTNVRAEPNGPPVITFLGAYEDLVQKAGGLWRFKIRTMQKRNIVYVESAIASLFTTTDEQDAAAGELLAVAIGEAAA
jgi:hypothetical protein